MTKAKMPVEICPSQAAAQAGLCGLWIEYRKSCGITAPDRVFAVPFARLPSEILRDRLWEPSTFGTNQRGSR